MIRINLSMPDERQKLTDGQLRYRRLLRDPRWAKFRTEVIEVDGGVCRRCGRAEPAVSMHVHHKRYVHGRLPWQYDYADLEALCAGCHAREHGILPPREGWDFVMETDLGDLNGECELCGTSIRYVFLIHHPHHEPMEVGCVCCDTLTGTAEASERQKVLERRDRFATSSRWKTRGGTSFIRQAKFDVYLVPCMGGTCLKIAGIIGRKVYASPVDAKRAAFDAIESGAVRRLVESRERARNARRSR